MFWIVFVIVFASVWFALGVVNRMSQSDEGEDYFGVADASANSDSGCEGSGENVTGTGQDGIDTGGNADATQDKVIVPSDNGSTDPLPPVPSQAKPPPADGAGGGDGSHIPTSVPLRSVVVIGRHEGCNSLVTIGEEDSVVILISRQE